MLNTDGYIPPQSVEIEEAILGALLLEPNSFFKVENILMADSFYKSQNKLLYSAICEMVRNNQSIDILTIVQKLKADCTLEQVGGPFALTQLQRSISSSANIEDWARYIQEMYQRREMIRICQENIKKSYDLQEDYSLILNGIQNELISSVQKDSNSLRHISSVANEVIELMKLNSKSDKSLSGIPTGFTDIDRSTGGLQKGDLIIIAGETSNGKTALALNIAQNCASLKHKVAVFSYEMTDIQLVSRHISAESGISSREIMFGRMNEYQIKQVENSISSLIQSDIFIDETNSPFDKLESNIRSAVIKNKIELVIVDYLQLIKLNIKGLSKTDGIAEIANSLKQVAKSLKIPIILISQLRRVEGSDPMPTMQRLKGSGDIENAADIIFLVWRPDIYKRDTFKCNDKNYNSNGLAHLIQAKGRNIGTGEYVLKFNPQLTLFTDHDKDAEFFDDIKPNENFDYPDF